MSDVVRNFLVGVTSIVALVGLAALLFLFGEIDWLKPRYAVTINAPHATNLRTGSAVNLNGVPIGVVDGIVLRPAAAYPVELNLMIDEGVEIPATVVPYATRSLLGGAAVLELEPGDDSGGVFLPTDGRAVLNGPIRNQLIEQLTAELDRRMKPLLSALGSFDELSAEYLALGRNLNELVGTEAPDGAADGGPPTMRTMLVRLDGALEESQAAFALAREWLSDEQLSEDVRAAVARARELIDGATEAIATFKDLAATLEGDADRLVNGLLETSDEAAITLEEIRRLATLASRGDGTVALLLRDPTLYRSLNDTAIQLDKAIVDARLLMQKIKEEGLPVNF